MIRSMTGFGKANGTSGSNLITVELKSLNSKFLELNLRLPVVYKDKDLELRNEITRVIERGKVDFTVTIDQAPGLRKNAFNKESIRNYYEDFVELKKELKLSSEDYLNIIMRLPNVLNLEKSESDPKEWKTISPHSAAVIRRIHLRRANELKISPLKIFQ